MDTLNIKDKLNKIAAQKTSNWAEKAKWRESNEAWLDKSAEIALKILRVMRAQGLTQKILADKLGVSAQYVSKIVKGNENLTLETICSLENVLGIELVSTSSFQLKTKVVTNPAHIYPSKLESKRSVAIGIAKYGGELRYSTYLSGDNQNSKMAA